MKIQPLDPAISGSFKALYRVGHPSDCPPDAISDGYNFLIEDGSVKRRGQFKAINKLGLVSAPYFLFMTNMYEAAGKYVETTYPVLVALCANNKVYCTRYDRNVNWQEVSGAVLTGEPTYAAVFTFNNVVYLFTDALSNQGTITRSTSAGTCQFAVLTKGPKDPDDISALADAAVFDGFEYRGRMIVTDGEFIHFSEELYDTFELTWPIRCPNNRSGFRIQRIFPLADYFVALTDKYPVIIEGTGITTYSQFEQVLAPGMYKDAKKCAAIGDRGIYYLDVNLNLIKFVGTSYTDISTPFLGNELREDMDTSPTAMKKSSVFCDGKYIYLNYVSKALDGAHRLLVWTEEKNLLVGDYRGYNVVCSAMPYKTISKTSDYEPGIVALDGATGLYGFPYYDTTKFNDFNAEKDFKDYGTGPTGEGFWDITETPGGTGPTGACYYDDGTAGSNVFIINTKATGLDSTHMATAGYNVPCIDYESEVEIRLKMTSVDVSATFEAFAIKIYNGTHILKLGATTPAQFYIEGGTGPSNLPTGVINLVNGAYNIINIKFSRTDTSVPVYSAAVSVNGALQSTISGLTNTTSSKKILFGDFDSTGGATGVNSTTWIDYVLIKSYVRESFTMYAYTKAFDQLPGVLKSFEAADIDIYRKAIPLVPDDAKVYALVDNKSTSLANLPNSALDTYVVGSRYGDEDNEIIHRGSFVTHRWIIPHSGTYITSGRFITFIFVYLGSHEFNIHRIVLFSNLVR